KGGVAVGLRKRAASRKLGVAVLVARDLAGDAQPQGAERLFEAERAVDGVTQRLFLDAHDAEGRRRRFALHRIAEKGAGREVAGKVEFEARVSAALDLRNLLAGNGFPVSGKGVGGRPVTRP